MKTVVVLGMPRTGSSLTAGICQILGFNMGEETAGYHPEWNPKGTYENAKFQRLDDRILHSLGGSWDNPPIVKPQPNKEIEYLVNNEKSQMWGWKGARTTLLIELYWPYLKNPYFIICQRRAKDIIASFEKTRMADEKKTRKLIEIYDRRIRDFIENHSIKYIYIQYEDYFQQPKRQIQKLIDFLEVKPKKEQIQQAIEFIIPR